jgi:hypothetical protein
MKGLTRILNHRVMKVRSLTFAGPYRIAKVNDDGTYDLNDEHGTLFKYKVKEKDLKPL